MYRFKKKQLRAPQEHVVFVTKYKQLNVVSENNIAIILTINSKHTNKLCGQNEGILRFEELTYLEILCSYQHENSS